jgi:putative flippase GtrA
MDQTIVKNTVGRPGVQQFIKFCIIGATSTVIDWSIFSYLSFSQHWSPNVAQLVSFSISVCNGYIWNSLWTFRGMGAGRRHEQFVKFLSVNVVGLLLTLTINNSVFFLFTGHFLSKGDPDKLHTYIAKAVALVLVVFWNFIANKKWTFANAAAT